MKLFFAATLVAICTAFSASASQAGPGFPEPGTSTWAYSGLSFTQPTCSNSNFQLVSDSAADPTGWTGTSPNLLSCYCLVTTAPGSNYLSSSVTVTVINSSLTTSGTTSISSVVSIGGNLLDYAGGDAGSTTNLINAQDLSDYTNIFDDDYYDSDSATDSSMTTSVAPLGTCPFTYTYTLFADAD